MQGWYVPALCSRATRTWGEGLRLAAWVGIESGLQGHARPIWFDLAADVAATLAPVRRQVLEHNEMVMRLCR